MGPDLENEKGKKLHYNLFLFGVALFLGIYVFIYFFFVFPFPGLFILLSMIIIYGIIILELTGHISENKTKFQWIVYNLTVAFATSLLTYVSLALLILNTDLIGEELKMTYLAGLYIIIFIIEFVISIVLTYDSKLNKLPTQ